MAVRLFVGNLPYDATEADLREHFSAVGTLSHVYIATDRETGKPRGFAFIEFNDRAQADEAIRRFANQPFKGRPLAVNEARAKENRAGEFRPQSGPPPRPAASQIPRGDAGDSAPQPLSRDDWPNRNFGPDAAPRRNRKQPAKTRKIEGRPKRPIRERTSGQIFSEDDYDELHNDDLIEENFASSQQDSQYEEQD